MKKKKIIFKKIVMPNILTFDILCGNRSCKPK